MRRSITGIMLILLVVSPAAEIQAGCLGGLLGKLFPGAAARQEARQAEAMAEACGAGNMMQIAYGGYGFGAGGCAGGACAVPNAGYGFNYGYSLPPAYTYLPPQQVAAPVTYVTTQSLPSAQAPSKVLPEAQIPAKQVPQTYRPMVLPSNSPNRIRMVSNTTVKRPAPSPKRAATHACVCSAAGVCGCDGCKCEAQVKVATRPRVQSTAKWKAPIERRKVPVSHAKRTVPVSRVIKSVDYTTIGDPEKAPRTPARYQPRDVRMVLANLMNDMDRHPSPLNY